MEIQPTPWKTGAHRDRALERRGWSRRFVGAPPTLDEKVRLYERLGYEVRLEPMAPDELREECGDCALALSVFRIVYTRSPE